MSFTAEQLEWCSRVSNLQPKASPADLEAFARVAADWAAQRYEEQNDNPIQSVLSYRDCCRLAERVIKASRILKPCTLLIAATSCIIYAASEINGQARDHSPPVS